MKEVAKTKKSSKKKTVVKKEVEQNIIILDDDDEAVPSTSSGAVWNNASLTPSVSSNSVFFTPRTSQNLLAVKQTSIKSTTPNSLLKTIEPKSCVNILSPHKKRKFVTPKKSKTPSSSSSGKRSGKKQVNLSSNSTLTPVRVSNDEQFCPSCQIPFRCLVQQSLNWHIMSCMGVSKTPLKGELPGTYLRYSLVNYLERNLIRYHFVRVFHN